MVGCAVVVVVVGGWLVVVVAGGCVGGGGGAGITVTVVVLFGPVTVTVCDVCGAGWFGGLVFVWPRVSANTTATSTATPAPTTLKTSAVRLYHGSDAVSAA